MHHNTMSSTVFADLAGLSELGVIVYGKCALIKHHDQPPLVKTAR